MPENEQIPSFVKSIEEADTPLEAVGALGRLTLRRMMAAPLAGGRNILKVVMLRSSANHH
jgi:hypothetical protein